MPSSVFNGWRSAWWLLSRSA